MKELTEALALTILALLFYALVFGVHAYLIKGFPLNESIKSAGIAISFLIFYGQIFLMSLAAFLWLRKFKKMHIASFLVLTLISGVIVFATFLGGFTNALVLFVPKISIVELPEGLVLLVSAAMAWLVFNAIFAPNKLNQSGTP